MYNNFWEELNMKDAIHKTHIEELEKVGLPDWAKFSTCPYCGQPVSVNSVRCIGIKLNTRNIGDIFMEVCCDKCRQMNTLYYRRAAPNIKAFVDLLENKSSVSGNGIIEEEMYKQNYNNLLELGKNEHI